MSGDSQRNDEQDFLDDDFVVEDLAGKNDDLEQLFDDPGKAKAQAPKPGAAPDSDDVLFTDHTQDVQASEQFAGGKSFAEDGKSTWRGEQLELDSDRPAAESDDKKLAAAKAAFSEELGSMLNEEELPLDSEKELELVDQPSADEVKEFEQSGAFVLEEGDGAWREQNEAPEQPAVEPEVAEAIWDAVKDPAMAEASGDEAAEAAQEPGWEALPEANVDELSEVDGVAEANQAEEVPTEGELAAVDGHDIYGDDAPALVGARGSGRRRSFMVVAAMAASLALVGGAAVLVMRPEWVGLQLEGERVQQVMVDRPRIDVLAAAPAAVPTTPRVAAGDPAQHDPTNPNVVVAPDPVASAPADPDPGVPFGPEPPANDPVAATPETAPDPRAIPGAAMGDPSPVASWPVALPAPGPKALPPSATTRNGKPNRLVRISDNVMLGGSDVAAAAPTARAVDGMTPGTRAFAQLYNGNYFIGSIKVVDADKVTLRLTEGEVTLAATEILRLTALGSADYDALQRATSGFVRLTNNNKLVGGILSQIADDHIVLEFRSNRVMLPKSAVGEVVSGDQTQPVRLDVTPQENDWVRTIAERQLGDQTPGTGAPSPNGSSTPIAPEQAKVGASPTTLPNPAPAQKRTPAAPARGR